MRKFQKPEKGVARYEVWTMSPVPHSDDWAYRRNHSEATLEKAMGWMRGGRMRTEAYVYDRRTGKVIATNEEDLVRRDSASAEREQ